MLARYHAALAALIALLSFLPALNAGFVYDDTLLIEENVRIQRWQGLLEAFTTHFWQTDAQFAPESTLVYYRPLVTFSFVLDWLLFAGQAWGFHLVNILLHALSAFLAARLALRWTRSPGLSLLIAVLFAVHPTRPESVVWIAGRTDLMMTVFALLSLEAAHRARCQVRAPGLQAACLLAFVAALLCKEGAFVLPLLLWADAANDEAAGLSQRSKRLLALSLALAAVYLALRLFVYPVRTSPGAIDLRHGLITVAAYVERLVWPFPQTFFYRSLMRDEAGPIYPLHLLLFGAAVCAGYCWLLIAAWRRDRVAALGLLAALSFIAPVLNFIETGIAVTVSDHFLYVPLLLLSLSVARLFARPLRLVSEKVVTGVAAALAVVCFFPNAARAADFRDNQSLWQHELSLDPAQPFALDWSAMQSARQGELRTALSTLERSFSPAANAHALLSRRALANGRWLRAVELTAALTPDGDARTLQLLYHELVGFWNGKPGPRGRVGWLELGVDRGQAATAQQLSTRGRSFLAAELAVIASRLGRTPEAQRWVRLVHTDDLPFLPTPLPFLLAVARNGDFETARRLRTQVGAGNIAMQLDERVLAQFSDRLERAERAVMAARGAPQRAPLLESLAQLELGGYLAACRKLRPIYERDPEDQEVAQLYAQALTAARLDSQARRVVERALGPTEGAAVHGSLRASLTPFLRDLPAAPDGDAWWQP